MKTQDVDLSKLKAGDTVHFRCGGKDVATEVSCNGPAAYPFSVRFGEKGQPWDYTKNGRFSIQDGGEPFDIIRVEPALRWEDVRPGMAFFDYDRDIIFYIGPDFEGGAVFSLEMSVSDETTWFVNKEDLKDLTPAPEHNIEVAK